jgi:hypothetical protein
MITIRLAKHWRIRRSEWLLALCTTALGVVYLLSPHLFDEPKWFTTMRSIMPQLWWGWLALGVGSMRLTVLFINGAWRASPHLRCVGAQVSCALWMTLFVSTISSEAIVQSVGFWALFFVFDAFSAIDAAGDARIEDEKARAARLGAESGDARRGC